MTFDLQRFQQLVNEEARRRREMDRKEGELDAALKQLAKMLGIAESDEAGILAAAETTYTARCKEEEEKQALYDAELAVVESQFAR